MTPRRQTAANVGLLVLRIGIGLMFIGHGLPKLIQGPDTWIKLGGAMSTFGITFAPGFWGLMCALAETLGGLSMVLGLLVRPLSFVLLINMIVASAQQITQGLASNLPLAKLFGSFSHPVELATVVLAVLIAGGGDYCLSRAFKSLRDKWFG